MMIRTFTSFLTIPIHIIPTQFPDYMFLLAKIAANTEPHIKIRTTLIDMPIWTMFPIFTFFLDKLRTNFQIMTKIASLSIWTEITMFKFLTCFNFRFIMWMWTTLALLTFTMNEFFTYTVCG